MIRHLFEVLGLLPPKPEPVPVPKIEEVRERARQINKEARTEIHKSREQRTVLQLEYELARRRHK